jgi:hypothetical protein
MKILLKFHQGWTDIILCLGLIYYYSEISNELVVIMRSDAIELMNFCFRNNKNIKFEYYIKEGHNEDYKTTELKKIYSNYIYKLHSHKYKNVIGGGYDFFYKQYDVPNDYSHLYFNIPRDLEIENKKFNDFKKNYNKKYIIINEDVSRNLKINRKYLPNEYLIFNLNNSSNIIFDMIKILENSEEIHTISTFWSLIILLLQKKYNLFKNKKIYFHNYVRNGYYRFLYENSNWKFID